MGDRGQNRLYSENKDYTYLQGSRKDMVKRWIKLNMNPGKGEKTTPSCLIPFQPLPRPVLS